MAYKEKTCPKCDSKHNKRGEFCSRSCGNSRPLTKEQKQKIGAAKSAWLTSGDEKAEAAIHSFTSLGNNKVADPVAPIVPRDAGYGRYVEDGDLWEEVWLQGILPVITTLCECMWEGYVERYVDTQWRTSVRRVYVLSSGSGLQLAILIWFLFDFGVYLRC